MSEFRNFENHSNDQFNFCWVIALRAEATPLIKAFNMKNVGNKSLFPIYTNEETGHALVISGIGSIKSAAAATFLKNQLKIKDHLFGELLRVTLGLRESMLLLHHLLKATLF